MNQEQKEYLDRYLAILSESQRSDCPSFSAGYFCGDEENANICADLVLHGQKTATCSLKYACEHDSEPYPAVGHLHVVTDWLGSPVAITRTLEVEEKPFSAVTEEFARAEGEGDRSLEWWRKAHWQFFSKECMEMGISPSENMLLVLERFEVVYK